MQGRILAYKNPKYDKHTKENTTHRILHTKVWQEKNSFTLKNIFMYYLERDRTLSSSKKEVKNDGIVFNLILKKLVINIHNVNQQ
jgi:hypothetical protein